MLIVDLFSKRQADAARSGQADVYQYTIIPPKLRVQTEQIALQAIGFVGKSGDNLINFDKDNEFWLQIETIYRREMGVDRLAHERFAGERILLFMRNCTTEEWLDLLELIAKSIRIAGGGEFRSFRQLWSVSVSAEDAINEINYRLRQAGVGYQVEGGNLIRVDSQFVHAEVVKPALALLSSRGFDGPMQEFLSAHQYYRAGEYRQAVSMAANALESTFKAIFDQKGWDYSKGARISDLVKPDLNSQTRNDTVS
ncbi:STM4504/CBY_0614 family protein [Acidocella sp. C78]|uniref:STM4504/CBY_0614 family protein n=1 Tax=Acidocella sp. C78 TaxID=1671486 RepID=UPI00191BC10B|nr:hypothetical protein [Acidocella sp. C78]